MNSDKEAMARGLEILKVKKEVKKVRKMGKDTYGEKGKGGKGGLDPKRETELLMQGKTQNKSSSEVANAYINLYHAILEKRKEIERLKEDLNKRQERFIKRRSKLQEILDELKNDLSVRQGKGTVRDENERKMDGKKREILDVIEAIPLKTKKMIDAEMEEYSKAFNTQVQNMKKEMNAYLTSKKEEETSAKQQEDLRMQLGLMYKATEKIDKENTKLMGECKQYEEDFKKQEQTRLRLFQQLVDKKKENANLLEQIAFYKLAITEVREDEEEKEDESAAKVMQSSFMSSSSKKLRGGDLNQSKTRPGYQSAYPLARDGKSDKDMIERYKGVIEKLQGTLESEKKKLKQSRLLYAREMQAKTELEELLYQCVEEVRSEVLARKQSEPSTQKKKPTEKQEFTKEQREKIVEMLLSQERVLALLYDKTFPAKKEEEFDPTQKDPDI